MTPELAQILERLLAVAIGGLSIFLGYRLFIQMPDRSQGNGSEGLPGGISIYTSRVLPAIFFSLLGAAALAITIYLSVVDTRVHPQAMQAGADGETEYLGGITKIGSVPTAGVPGANQSTRVWDSLDLQLEVEFLNSLPSLLRKGLSEADRRMVRTRTERSKLVVMGYVWEPKWGRFEEFRRWIDEGSPDPIPPSLQEAVAYYRQGGGKP